MALPELEGQQRLKGHNTAPILPRLCAHSTAKQTELLPELPAPGSGVPSLCHRAGQEQH